MTGIAYCDLTWNPAHGCDKESPGCTFCWALQWTFELEHGNPKKPNNKRPFAGLGLTYTDHKGNPQWTGKVVPDMKKLTLPSGITSPKVIFINSMFDLFHRKLSPAFIQLIFDECRRAHWHQFIFLTKRSSRMAKLAPHLDWPDNVNPGVSIEDDERTYRADNLRVVGNYSAGKLWVSAEPLISAVPSLNTEGVHWMIPGGASGPDFRPMPIEWVEEIAKKCAATNTALFVKQDASRKDGTKGRFKHFPHLWVREWPMPGPNDHQLRRFYRETEGKAKVM